MKPFDLEKALAGEPVNVIGDTIPKRIIAKSAYHDDLYIVEDKHSAYTLSLADLQEGFEMWQEPRPRVKLDLPCPLKEPQDGMCFITTDGYVEVLESQYEFDGDYNKYLMDSGFYFATKEDAQEWLEAMQGARR